MPTGGVALVRGEERYDDVSQALKRIVDKIDLSNKQQVLVKSNFVVTHRPLAATHVDGVTVLLDFMPSRYDGPIIVAEEPATQPAAEGFRLHGYEPLAGSHGVTFADLNHDEPVTVDVYHWRLRPLRLRLGLARSIVESCFRISVGPPMTHDVVIATLSLKNVVMGSLLSRFTHGQPSNNEDDLDMGKMCKVPWRMVPIWVRRLRPVERVHLRAMSTLEPSDKMENAVPPPGWRSHPVINLNLARLAPVVMPSGYVQPVLAVTDGCEAMEGSGPSEGTPVPLHLALTRTDPLAADVVGAALMGCDADKAGYLHYCKEMGMGAADLAQMKIVGNATPADCAGLFRPHDTYQRQQRWMLPRAEEYLT